MRASGLMPSSRARLSDMTTTAAAPSLSGQALPAVTRPSGRKAGFSLARSSAVVCGRGPSSALTVEPSGSVAGVMSFSKKPCSMARPAFCWHCSA